MKKFKLVAIATMLAGTTLCASAADVQMYGLVATGVVYQHRNDRSFWRPYGRLYDCF